MNSTKIPTILGIAILIVGLIDGVVFVKNKQILKVSAEEEVKPKNIRVSNVEENSLNISWTTEKKTSGFVRFGKNNLSMINTAIDSFENENYLHYVTLSNLDPDTSYFFLINSDGNEFNNNGEAWRTKTAKEIRIKPLSNIISGTIIKQSGAPINNAIVYASIGSGSLLSTRVDTKSKWFINITLARAKTLDGYISVEESITPIEIFVQSGPQGIASVQTYAFAAKPVPPIILGQNVNLDSPPATDIDQVPEAEINIPL